jgi:hypothetical protein
LTIQNFDIHYYSEENYNNGNFSSEFNPSLIDQAYYAVIDLNVISKEENDGNLKVNFLTKMPGRGLVDITVESASTSEIEEIDSLDGTTIYTSFTAPSAKNESKNIRIILRLKGITGGSVPVSFTFSSDNTTGLDWHKIITKSFLC